MATKNTRSGGKYSGNHTTVIPAAAIICDIAHSLPQVINISPGFIKGGLTPVNGNRRVKITDNNGCVLLSVRDNTTHQEVRVYSNDIQAAKLAVACGARNAGLRISFGAKPLFSAIPH